MDDLKVPQSRRRLGETENSEEGRGESKAARKKRLRAIADHKRFLREKGTALYRTKNTWGGMIYRCYNSKSSHYARYGAVGIRVCDRWRKFRNFVEDMGLSPAPGMSIDRIDGKGNYEPSNCRWATPTQQTHNQSNNRWVIYSGQKLLVGEAAKRLGFTYTRLHLWLWRHPEYSGDLNRLIGVQHGSRNFIELKK